MSHLSSQTPEITAENLSQSPRSAGSAWAREKRFAEVLGRRMAYIERGAGTNHDVYGDGSIVVVPAAGHTPGGVVIFVTLPSGTRYAFVGDVVWRLEGITEREERPWVTRRRADTNSEANGETSRG